MDTDGNNQGFIRADRDLLVALDTKMSIIQSDVKDLREGTSVRLTTVEREKIDRADVLTMKQDADKQRDALAKKDEDLEKQIADIDKKVDVFIARMTTYGSIALVVLGVAEFVIQLWLRNH